jgi:hypothetical protein
MEGVLRLKLKDSSWSDVREGQTVVISAEQFFTMGFGSRYVRAILFTNGPGIEEIIRRAGKPCASFVLPDEIDVWEESEVEEACIEIGSQTSSFSK